MNMCVNQWWTQVKKPRVSGGVISWVELDLAKQRFRSVECHQAEDTQRNTGHYIDKQVHDSLSSMRSSNGWLGPLRC